MRRLAVSVFVTCLAAFPVRGEAQTVSPAAGGYIHSLGLPRVYKPYLGFANGLSRDRGDQLSTQFRLGIFRDLGNPVTELLGVSVELYGGFRDVHPDYGLRAFALSHLLCLGAGVDYDLRFGTPDLLLTLVTPLRRAGVLGRGSDLRVEWLPTRAGTVNVAVTLPLAQPHRGHSRPRLPYVELARPPLPQVTFAPDSMLAHSIAEVTEAGTWINRLMMPSFAGTGAATLKGVLADRTADQEIRLYHRALSHAFAVAAGDPELGAGAAARAKAIMLEFVLLPYNRLLGQKKNKDTTREFARNARGVFARWLVTESGIPATRADAAEYVFQTVLGLVETIREANAREWGDSRLTWLPLQLALTPDQYDEQQELDEIISHAVGEPLTQGNRVSYIPNERFQPELIRSISRAKEYHVLWVHDFRGEDDHGHPDRLALAVVTQAYLAALRRRVEQYDSTGHLPVFMIFLDQYYFEQSHSRPIVRVLQDPLDGSPNLPAKFDSIEQVISAAQDSLRRAVAASRLLQAERAQFGEPWLRALVKVHVSITNPSDPSFRSGDVFPWVGIPDDVIRDHRKVVLYDVSETDPYRGLAMYTGMGVGEKYSGPEWEDRAIMVQGPAALGLRDKARALLLTQGIPLKDIPLVLLPHPQAPDYDARVQADIDSMQHRGEIAAGVIELHNQTGFAMKEIAVAEATLFNLMSPGGVVKVPDSIWLNQLYGSLLAGAALRGVRVLVIATSKTSAPDLGWPVVGLIHDLLSRLLAFQHELAPELARAGGMVHVGLYEPKTRVDDLRGRVAALKQSLAVTPFLRDLYAFDPAVYRILDSSGALLSSADEPAADGKDEPSAPKLHMKGFLYLSREAWEQLLGGPPMVASLRAYLAQRERQIAEGPQPDDSLMTRALERASARTVVPMLKRLSPAERRRLVLYLQVGSPNQDYRSMVMDGEAAVLVSGLTSFDAVPDFVLLAGLASWVDDRAALDRGLPPPGGLKKRLAHWARMAL